MPQIRRPGTKVYQFEMPAEMHEEGRAKADEYGFSLAELFRKHYQDFIDRPIADSMEIIREHNNKQRRPIKKGRGGK